MVPRDAVAVVRLRHDHADRRSGARALAANGDSRRELRPGRHAAFASIAAMASHARVAIHRAAPSGNDHRHDRAAARLRAPGLAEQQEQRRALDDVFVLDDRLPHAAGRADAAPRFARGSRRRQRGAAA